MYSRPSYLSLVKQLVLDKNAKLEMGHRTKIGPSYNMNKLVYMDLAVNWLVFKRNSS